jgi:hypothetical protein
MNSKFIMVKPEQFCGTFENIAPKINGKNIVSKGNKKNNIIKKSS